MGGIAPDVVAVADPVDSLADDPATDASQVGSKGKAWKDAAEPITTLVTSYIKNPGVGTLLLGVFLILKCSVMSKGDIPIALGILQNAGLPTIVVGGLLSGLPILVAVMLAGTIFNAFAHKDSQKQSVEGLPLSPKQVVALAAVVLSLIFTQWPIMVLAVVIGLVITWIHRPQVPKRKNVAYAAAVVCAVYGLTVMLYSVWLPREKLTITGIKTPTVGYVLSDNPDGWITILVSQQHGIVSYRESDVEHRQACDQAPYNFWSQFTDAATPWQEITKWSLLRSMHAAPEPPC
jgi:hypothetical protein